MGRGEQPADSRGGEVMERREFLKITGIGMVAMTLPAGISLPKGPVLLADYTTFAEWIKNLFIEACEKAEDEFFLTGNGTGGEDLGYELEAQRPRSPWS